MLSLQGTVALKQLLLLILLVTILANVAADQVEIVHGGRVTASSAINLGSELIELWFQHHQTHSSVKEVAAQRRHQLQFVLLQLAKSFKT